MTKLRVHAFGLSLDGYGAGPNQSLDNPMGVGAENLHKWFIPTDTFAKMGGRTGTTGTDNDLAATGFENIGAWIMGRNMFTHSRGPWPDDDWKGWWGKNPPYHVPVFVLTHHPRESVSMEGGTVFHFVTDGIESALERAKDAAKDKDIRLGGGVSTVRQYLKAGLIDEMHLTVSPTLLGSGENLLAGIDTRALGYECTRHVGTELTSHFVIAKK
jgi:dihydrofolate reductase